MTRRKTLKEHYVSELRGMMVDGEEISAFSFPESVELVNPLLAASVPDARIAVAHIVGFLSDAFSCHDLRQFLSQEGQSGLAWLLNLIENTLVQCQAFEDAVKEAKQQDKPPKGLAKRREMIDKDLLADCVALAFKDDLNVPSSSIAVIAKELYEVEMERRAKADDDEVKH